MLSIALPLAKTPLGIILYEGPSVLNGKKIVVIATGLKGDTHNPKTGSLIQTWIISADIPPFTAVMSGDDVSVCGDCKHRSVRSGGMGTCYVNVPVAPTRVYEAYKRGSYDKPTRGSIGFFNNRLIRLGSYGDPASVPLEIWNVILKNAKGWVGYTHQWNNPNIDKGLMKYCMASVDSKREALAARALGWRTFRVRSENEPLIDKEFVCPASVEAGNRLTCDTCMACHGGEFNASGEKGKGKGSPVIIAHGRPYKIRRFYQMMKLKERKQAWRHLLVGMKV